MTICIDVKGVHGKDAFKVEKIISQGQNQIQPNIKKCSHPFRYYLGKQTNPLMQMGNLESWWLCIQFLSTQDFQNLKNGQNT